MHVHTRRRNGDLLPAAWIPRVLLALLLVEAAPRSLAATGTWPFTEANTLPPIAYLLLVTIIVSEMSMHMLCEHACTPTASHYLHFRRTLSMHPPTEPAAAASPCIQYASSTLDIPRYRMDRYGDDIGYYGSHALATCNSNPSCKAFNTNGWVKRSATPQIPWWGSCLYVKSGSNVRPSPSPGAVVSTAGCSDAGATLTQHNTYRARHSAAALVWDETLAKQAQAWAQALASGCRMQHSGAQGVGENLYLMSTTAGVNPSALRCIDAANSWYSEVSKYRFTNYPWNDNRANFGNIGHFTQVVRKSSTTLGCGAAAGGGNTCVIVVCRYRPPGNYATDDEFRNNVRPPIN
ncbi:hypothetical protein VOLCADRAFT_107377 [Volvox carteri f. nagariensis]|uniref:SCP domain-containing protein n=1 Tax=Volvox carteri f. nagariensis TaxID=3068 RepID=D8UDM4_VOLCA|nr:uncharacterized protein VOLCADRAFT_107377 [Volvox carteri f. nagariensis]EFJ42219.1 hypothetical protein VOLCADRAFT_107377 [Volvox carteri f. nagariensis]|eukprot:XP_002956762.1 hypothetical protein VOLCADRAFT_107377 [Volvox carteri f. nagariensis]